MKNFKKYIILAILFSTIVSFHSTSVFSKEIVDRISAIVNNEIITLYELNSALEPYKKSIEAAPENQRINILYEAEQEMLENLIEQKLTAQEAKRLDFSVDEEQIDQSLANFKEQNNMNDQDFNVFLKKEKISLEDYRDMIRGHILRDRLVSHEVRAKIVITQKAISEYYQANIEKFNKKKIYRLYNLFMKVNDFQNYIEKEEVLKKMLKIAENIENGHPFQKMASEYSEAMNASAGGELGKIDFSSMSDKIQEVLTGVKEGEVTPVIETPDGYQIFYIKSIEETGGKTLEEATPIIKETLYRESIAEKFATWINALKRKSHIKIMN